MKSTGVLSRGSGSERALIATIALAVVIWVAAGGYATIWSYVSAAGEHHCADGFVWAQNGTYGFITGSLGYGCVPIENAPARP